MTSTGIGTLKREAPGLIDSDDGRPASGRQARPKRPSRRWTLTAVAVGLLLLVLAVVAVTAGKSAGATLDPRSASPGGSRAVAELLRGRGIEVNRGTYAGSATTVVVPFREALSNATLVHLLSSGADVVLIDPGAVAAAQLSPEGSLDVKTRAPRCELAPADTAGPARLGGTRYVSANSATSCYDGALLALAPGSIPGGGRLTVLGSADILTNERLDQQGNAALALGLLDRQPTLTWYTTRRMTSGTSLTDLLPEAVPWALLQIAIAVVVIGLWRGRRLGPVVTEPLPVVVRAAETVLGRARLYAAARARNSAAEALRMGSRTRLAELLHLDPAAGPPALIAAVAGRAGAEPPAVAALLYESGGYGSAALGATGSDAALVRLADELDQLENRVREVARR